MSFGATGENTYHQHFPAYHDAALAPFSADVLLPSQFHSVLQINPHAFRSCEQKLLLAALQDALNTLQQYYKLKTLPAHRLAVEAQNWLMSSDDSYLFSFVNVCLHLGLNAEATQSKLRKLYPPLEPFSAKKRVFQQLPEREQVRSYRKMRRRVEY